jgi:hypothetical protein
MIFHPAKSNPRQPSSYSGATVSKCSTHAQWTQRLETQVGFGKKQRGLLVGNSDRVKLKTTGEQRMKAYHGELSIKKKYLARVRAHRKADQLLQGFGYWQDGKGCAVGCTIHGRDHSAYETELGIPRMVARLEDGIFEGLPKSEVQLWPERFLDGIVPGQDLAQVGDRFLHWLIADPQDGVIRFAKTDAQRKAIGRVGELCGRKVAGEKIRLRCWREARVVAYAAGAYAAGADAVDAAARHKARVRQSEKLLELLKAAPL